MRNLHDVVYTGFLGELEHLKIKTRLIDEMFVSVMGEYLLWTWPCYIDDDDFITAEYKKDESQGRDVTL